jgi:hypothetical protein
VTPDSTEASLRAVFGEKAVTKLLPGDEMNEEEYVTILYGEDPSRTLTVVWDDKSASHLRYIGVCRSRQCVWHTQSGIRMGVTLTELERRNGRPLSVSSWATDYYPGAVESWEGGLLEKELEGVNTSLCLSTEQAGQIDTGPGELSSNPVLKRFNPKLCEIEVSFDTKSVLH